MKVQRPTVLKFGLVLCFLRADGHLAAVTLPPGPVAGPGLDRATFGRMPYHRLVADTLRG
jgi:hypothetical protein